MFLDDFGSHGDLDLHDTGSHTVNAPMGVALVGSAVLAIVGLFTQATATQSAPTLPHVTTEEPVPVKVIPTPANIGMWGSTIVLLVTGVGGIWAKIAQNKATVAVKLAQIQSEASEKRFVFEEKMAIQQGEIDRMQNRMRDLHARQIAMLGAWKELSDQDAHDLKIKKNYIIQIHERLGEPVPDWLQNLSTVREARRARLAQHYQEAITEAKDPSDDLAPPPVVDGK